ncbi:MAG: FliA/WhiG family RNA polymerase sigma factor [Gemmatimonadota bacterium]
MESTALWAEFTTNGSAAARDKLLNEHLGLVHHVARQLSKTLAADVDFDELVSCGVIGLMNALESFDASRGLAFSTFAAPRIRGAILDELRRQDHVPRSIRKKSRDIGGAREALTREHGHAPDDQTIAKQLGVDMDTFWRWQADVEGIFHLPLDVSTAPAEKSAPTPAELLSGEENDNIEDELNLEEEVGVLREAIMELKEQERVVLSLYYFEELKLHEIATILELTESRISQIRSKSIQKLRVQMGKLREQVA